MNRIASTLVLASFAFAASFAFFIVRPSASAATEHAPTYAPVDRAVDVPPPSLVLPEGSSEINASPVTIAVKRPSKTPSKVWTCGAPRKLANDAVQTVRECEFR